MIKLAEPIFGSLQGEGPYSGVPSTFIRFAKCLLQCSFCDSKFTWESGKINLSENYNSIIQQIAKYEDPHVVITGGEPLIYYKSRMFQTLINDILKMGKKITFETTMITNVKDIKETTLINNLDKIYKEFDSPKNLVFVVSPKLSPGDYRIKVTKDEILKFYEIKDYDKTKYPYLELYYKIIHSSTYEEPVYKLLRVIDNKFKDNVYMMSLTPMNNFSEDIYKQKCIDTAEFCKENKLKFSSRLHIDLWGLKKGC